MKTAKKLIGKFKKLHTKDKVQLFAALAITISVFAALPSFAWFSGQKQMATMAKINSPAKLSLKAGAGEDIINFRMSGIDVTKKNPLTNDNSKDFVFCVEGAEISQYNIQLAHTTNINFTYRIYNAKQAQPGVEYIKASDSSPVYYQKAGSPLTGNHVNGTDDSVSGRMIGNTNYEEESYKNGNAPDSRQKFAEPLYWQTSTPIIANGTEFDEDTDDDSFRNYYVLEVSWDSSVQNDKETDMIYITAQVAK